MDVWVGLIGVVIGGLLSWWGTWTTTGRQIGAERELRMGERRRSDALPVASRLIGAADEMWDADRALVMAIFSMTNAEKNRDPQVRDEMVRQYDAQRVDAMAKYHDANRRARLAAAELAIVSADLDEPAQALIEASRVADTDPRPLPSPEQRKAQATARTTFVTEARKVLIAEPLRKR